MTNIQGQRRLVSYGSCAFGVTVGFEGTAVVGNEDIRDLVRDSITKFRRSDGKVGSKGTMTCGGSGRTVY
jgi:Pathogen effector